MILEDEFKQIYIKMETSRGCSKWMMGHVYALYMFQFHFACVALTRPLRQLYHLDKRLLHHRIILAAGKATQIGVDLKQPINQATDENSKCPPEETYESLRSIFSASVSLSCSSILLELEAAENLSNFPIDFQI